ncbi:MAG: hypothetical protein IPK16_32260 [Anaerolineales bacterium]|nr:hypothetical protein [Anaerolineales bacterium]
MGCPKNRVDSDGDEMLLRQADHREAGRPGDADIPIVNTCGFLESAAKNHRCAQWACQAGKHQLLIAAGCLVRAVWRRGAGASRWMGYWARAAVDGCAGTIGSSARGRGATPSTLGCWAIVRGASHPCARSPG